MDRFPRKFTWKIAFQGFRRKGYLWVIVLLWDKGAFWNRVGIGIDGNIGFNRSEPPGCPLLSQTIWKIWHITVTKGAVKLPGVIHSKFARPRTNPMSQEFWCSSLANNADKITTDGKQFWPLLLHTTSLKIWEPFYQVVNKQTYNLSQIPSMLDLKFWRFPITESIIHQMFYFLEDFE